MGQENALPADSRDLERAYHEHKDGLWRFIMSLSGDPERSEDILHDVFERACRLAKQGKILKGNPIKPLLYRIAHGMHVNKWRNELREAKRVKDFYSICELRLGFEPADIVPKVRLLIRQVLAGRDLTERQKEVLVLRLYGHLSVAEVAAVSELSQAMVYRDLKLCFQRLRPVFELAGLSPEDRKFSL